MGNLDIGNILNNFKQYEQAGYNLTLCIVIRDKNKFRQMLKRVRNTSCNLTNILNRKSTIIIDWDDLIDAHYKFKYICSEIKLIDLYQNSLNFLTLKMHQKFSVAKNCGKWQVAKKF